MARPREFNRDMALDRAMSVFWTRGYDRTSIQDLVDSMGIQRGSLYAAFGDKHQLFLEALDRYEERFYEDTTRVLAQAQPAREGIREVFQRVLTDCACEDGSKGCFITNTAVALADGDEETAARVRANLRRLEDAFAGALERALERGELSPNRDARSLARFLTNSLQGLRVLSKCCVDLDVLQDAVAVTLSVLNEPTRKVEPSRQGAEDSTAPCASGASPARMGREWPARGAPASEGAEEATEHSEEPSIKERRAF